MDLDQVAVGVPVERVVDPILGALLGGSFDGHSPVGQAPVPAVDVIRHDRDDHTGGSRLLRPSADPSRILTVPGPEPG